MNNPTHKFNANGFYWLQCSILCENKRKGTHSGEVSVYYTVAAEDGKIWRCVTGLVEL